MTHSARLTIADDFGIGLTTRGGGSGEVLTPILVEVVVVYRASCCLKEVSSSSS
jgi:hypothetical protein